MTINLQSYESGMSEYFRMHDYRSMYSLFQKMIAEIKDTNKSDDSDIRHSVLEGFFGGNGDMYLRIVEEKADGLMHANMVRISTSGGNFDTDTKVACADLIRSLNK